MNSSRLTAMMLLAGSAMFAHADVTFGGTRSSGMGGAGLALPIDIGNNFRMNPAFLAYGNKAFAFQWPQLGYRLDGIGTSDIKNLVGDLNNGGLDNDKIIDIARDYSNSRKTIAANANLGFRLGGFAIGGRGEVGLNTVPNAQLQNWAANGGNTSNVDPGSRLDAYGYGYQQLDVAFGATLRTTAGRLSIGANVKRITGYYAHKFADRDTIQSGNSGGVQNGSGIVGDFAESQSTGVDLGMLYSPPKMDNVYLGLAIENFVEPGIVFPFEAPGGAQPITGNGFDPYKRTYSAGFGYVQDKLLLAADVIDIGNASGRAETRYGAELAISKSFAIRAGYNSRTAFTFGLSLGGFNIQVAGNAPITLGTVIRF